MRTVPLGKTGLSVSSVAFGGIPIMRLSEADAVHVVGRCIELGATFIDTAHAYSTSEARIGKALAQRPTVRQGLVLATKSGARDGATFSAHLENSFGKLGVDHIDLLQFHNISTPEHLEQVLAPGGPLDLAREALSAGRIGHIGVTSHNLGMAIELVKLGHFETMMFPFNYIGREPAEELLPLCKAHGVGFIAMKPMGGGMLDNATLSFKWLRQFSAAIPVVGIETSAEIEEIVGIANAAEPLTDAERAEIERLVAELGNRFCRSCDYCQPCPQEIAISRILRIQSFAKRMPPEKILGPWDESVATAESCLECGECESRCPYGLPIREMLKDSAAWYHEQVAASA